MILTSKILGHLDHGFAGSVEPLPVDVILPDQVHGTRVVKPENLDDQPADGLWIRSGDSRAIGIRTADCVPVLMATADGSIAAAIHAGWRGAAARIVEKFVIRRQGVPRNHWRVALGPAAGGCCYQVGPEVARRFGLGPIQTNIDLRQILTKRLAEMGIRHVEAVGGCTICADPGWASYRRDGRAAGRNTAWLRLRDAG